MINAVHHANTIPINHFLRPADLVQITSNSNKCTRKTKDALEKYLILNLSRTRE